MNPGTDASNSPLRGQSGPTTEHRLAEVDELLRQGRVNMRFPRWLETIFRCDMASARISGFTKIGLIGIAIYNAFIFVNFFILTDIVAMIAFVQIVLVSPLLVVGIVLINKRFVLPERMVTINLMLVVGSAILFYSQSHARLSGLYIFTIPVCLAFGNIVLPLPFRLSALFTGFCVVLSSVAAIAKADQDQALTYFAIVINANTGIYMLIATFRMELSERHAFLVNLREKLRAEVLDANNTLLRNLSETDALTGVANRRAFDDWYGRLWTEARNQSEPISILLIDIDHFKRLNDTHGHQAGDRALRCIAQCLKRHVSPGSIVARYGGEEFAVLFSGGNLAHGLAYAEVLREAIAHLHDTADGAGLPTSVTVSIGLATARPAVDGSCTDLISAADQALYKAKETGRNQIVSFCAEAMIPLKYTPVTQRPKNLLDQGCEICQ